MMLPAALLFGALRLGAHCDALDGPVAQAARRALESGDAAKALIWVQPEQEAELKQAFARAAALRRSGGEVKDLADTWFLETIVRLHRAGEGAPYTGLKAAGRDLGPAIPAADRALQSGSADALIERLAHEAAAGVRARFERAKTAKLAAGQSVAAGREFVAAYVDFLHYVEGVHQAASRKPAAEHGHQH
jgi:hypothetical protein